MITITDPQLFNDVVVEAANRGLKCDFLLSWRPPQVRTIAQCPDRLIVFLYDKEQGNYWCHLRRNGSKYVWIDPGVGVEQEFDDLESLRWTYELPYSVIEAADYL